MVLYNLFVLSSVFQEIGHLVFPFYSYPLLSPDIWIPVSFLPVLWQRCVSQDGMFWPQFPSGLHLCPWLCKHRGVEWNALASEAVWPKVPGPGCSIVEYQFLKAAKPVWLHIAQAVVQPAQHVLRGVCFWDLSLPMTSTQFAWNEELHHVTGKKQPFLPLCGTDPCLLSLVGKSSVNT